MRHAEDNWQGNSFENILKTSIRLETAETLVCLGKLDDAAFIGSSMIDVPHESHTLKLAILEQITSIQILSGIFFVLRVFYYFNFGVLCCNFCKCYFL